MIYTLGPTSSDAIRLYPEYDYDDGAKQLRSETRTKTGKLFLYKFGDYEQIKFKSEYVPAADAALMNSWWSTNTKLLWFVESGGVCDVTSVLIMNKKKPYSKFQKPYVDHYKGKILLEGY